MIGARRRSALVGAVAVVALVVGGCDADRRAVSRDDLPDVPAAPDHVVVLDDAGFDTAELEVTSDDVVEFRIEGDEPRGIATEEHEIDTGLLFPGESTFVVFDEEKRHVVADLADDDHVIVIESRPPERPAEP